MVRLCNGSDLPRADKNKVYLLRSYGTSGHEIWDVTDPAKPSRVTVVVSGLRDTHKSWWNGDTGIAYIVSGPPDWRTRRMTKIYDLSDPSSHRSFATSACPASSQARQARFRPTCTGLSPPGRKAIACTSAMALGRAAFIQILDREKLLKGPKEPTKPICYTRNRQGRSPCPMPAHTRRFRCSVCK